VTRDLDKPKRNLPAIATELRQEVEAAELAWRDAVGHAIRAGELLTEAKAQVKHGEWLPWLEANFPGAPRTAQDYMRLAANAEDARRAAHLGVKGALAELAAPAEDDARSAAHSDGLPETVAEIKEMVASEAVKQMGLDQMEAIGRVFDAEKPRREDFHPPAELGGEYGADIAEARYLLACQEHAREKRLAWYRLVVANAATIIEEDPIEGPPFIANCATGIQFLVAERRYETSPENEHDGRYATVQKAWMTHRAARDAYYRASGETPMDERPLDFNDAIYHPLLQRDEEEAA
jgi:hypothetical protein